VKTRTECEENRERAKDVVVADMNADKNAVLVGIMRGVLAMATIVIALSAASLASFRATPSNEALGFFFSGTATLTGLFLGWLWWHSMNALVRVTSARIEAKFAVIDADYDDCVKGAAQP